MVAGDPQPEAVQGADRPADGPCAHHHHGYGLVPVPPHRRSAQDGKGIGEDRTAHAHWLTTLPGSAITSRKVGQNSSALMGRNSLSQPPVLFISSAMASARLASMSAAVSSAALVSCS